MSDIDNQHAAVYESQRDNIFDGKVTCAVTCLSMLIQSKGMTRDTKREPLHLEDAILTDLRTRYPKNHHILREDFIFLAKYAGEKYGVKLNYAPYKKDAWIDKIKTDAAPFMTSTSNALTSFGHIVLQRGCRMDNELLLLMNDPYGVFPYTSKQDGEGVFYPAAMFPADDGKGTPKIYHTLSYA